MEKIEGGEGVSRVLLGVLDVIKLVLYIPLSLTLVLSVGYVFAVFGLVGEVRGDAAQEIRGTLASVWQGLLPVATQALRIFVPVITLMIIFGVLKWVMPSGAFSLDRLKDNLPAALALIVISTISMLPLLGGDIPMVLGNMAMVIVGYYFGKLKS